VDGVEVREHPALNEVDGWISLSKNDRTIIYPFTCKNAK
jgi:hypothetical protein